MSEGEPRRSLLSQAGSLAISALLLIAIWQLLVTLTQYPAWLLPGPLDVIARLRQSLADGTLQSHMLPTVIESLGGFALAVVVGTALGYGVAHSRLLERWIVPYFAALQAIPVIAIAPLIFIWFGSSSDIVRNIIIAAIVVVFPIFNSALTGIRRIPRELREVALVSGATPLQRLTQVELPLALPVLFSGLRTSAAIATTGAVVGEFIGTRYGLGAMINIARGFFDTPLIFVGLLCLGLITLVLHLALIILERLIVTWQE